MKSELTKAIEWEFNNQDFKRAQAVCDEYMPHKMRGIPYTMLEHSGNYRVYLYGDAYVAMSYDAVIAVYHSHTDGKDAGYYMLFINPRYWKFSRTTSNHLRRFLRDYHYEGELN